MEESWVKEEDCLFQKKFQIRYANNEQGTRYLAKKQKEKVYKKQKHKPYYNSLIC